MLSTLRAAWRRSFPTGETKVFQVTVYSRRECGCCEKAMEVLDGFRHRHRLHIETVDIDEDPALKARYDTMVPVVAIDGKVRFKGKVNPVLLGRILKAGSQES